MDDFPKYLFIGIVIIAIVAAVIGIAVSSREYKIIVGKIVDISYPHDDMMVLEFDDGTVMAFGDTDVRMIIGATYRIEYRSHWGEFRIYSVKLISLNGGR